FIEYGRVNRVAIGLFDTNSPGLLLQLAHAFQQRWDEREERRRLQDENQGLSEQVSQDFEELMFLRHIAGELGGADLDGGLQAIAEQMLGLLNELIRATSLVFIEAAEKLTGGRLAAWAGAHPPDDATCRALLANLSPAARAEPFVRNRLHQATDHDWEDARELVIVPVSVGKRVVGWLMAVNRERQQGGPGPWHATQHEFGTHEASLMSTAASIMAAQARNVDMIQEKEELLVKMIRSLVSALEAKDEYTCGHSERVAMYARRLALGLGYTPERADRLYLTGLLHDIGKIGVSDAALKKPGRLTDEEFEDIKRHPDEGWAILHELKPLAYVLPGMLQHHERVDGLGYPDGLKDDDISLDGRILAVVDAYDAMTSDRPYRQGMPVEKAEAILCEGAGTQWDTRVVEAFFEVREDINHIRQEYRPRVRRVRPKVQPAPSDVMMSHVVDDDGQVLAWS
ncbi:MAG: HD-GYP domain-containing protein, partial [Planctomycetales bacterium]|nr:HD-GYP domain-containing protein [Planctomycetales bacterium]